MGTELVTTQILNDWAALLRLREEWNPLLARSQADSVFLTWEWVDAWREGVEGSVQPFVVTARDASGALVGIAPLYLTRMRLLHRFPVRALRVLGDYHSGGEYGDWILDPRCEAEAGFALARALAGARRLWHCLWMPNVAGWTRAHERIASSSARAGLRVRDRPKEFSAAELPPDYNDYWTALSSNVRSAIRRQAKRLEAGGCGFVQCTSSEEVPSLIDALVELNDRRWKAEGTRGTFQRKPLELAFYRRFTPVALARGWLRLFALKMAGEFTAVQIGYAYDGSFLQLQEGFDPAGPGGQGNVLRSRVVEACIREGLSTYDFLGGHTEHKRRWLARPRRGYDLFVANRTAASVALHAMAVWPTGRYLRPESIEPRRSTARAVVGQT